MDTSTHSERYKKELVGSVIPFWENHSIDTTHGGYYNSLDRDGSVYDTEKYMWMQWREVYTWATLAVSQHAGKKKETWLGFARQGFDFLHDHGRDEAGNYYFVLGEDGTPIVAPHNIFSEAFAVLGSAALFKATGEARYKAAALEAMDHYVARIPDPKGRWNKRLPSGPKRLAHGPYMILANLGTVIKDDLGISDYDEAVKDSVDMVIDKFWNDEHHVLFENINDDFTIDLGSCDGRHLNPGHGLESAWFVLQHAERNHRPELVPKACKIIKALLDRGWDKEHGGIFYFMDVLGKPHVELSWDMKLWWVHLEALVATLMAFRMTGDEAFWKMYDELFSHQAEFAKGAQAFVKEATARAGID
ncbi:MAG: AGE family epimerase/isomerase, partial [Candidatus Lokiarchaeota archaeon]|nr:AGE family epimerase/isomerase [Candidatus Lokiarchaeota archaeon]